MSNIYPMDPRFSPHNSHLEDPAKFKERDPQLRLLTRQKYIYHSPLLDEFPTTIPGIYTLGGGRQIGKSTLLKQWMLELLNKKVPPQSIAFLTGELIEDNTSLLYLLQNQLASMPEKGLKYVILDEVTYIKNWDKTIKYMADAGLLDQTILMLTGSDLSLIQEARLRFPGRRGAADIANFHLYPLSFREVVVLKNRIPSLKESLKTKQFPIENKTIEALYEEFQEYLQHGGYLTAINDLALHQTISRSTLTTYSDWIRGDVLKRGKQEAYLREILAAIIKRYNSQVTWNALAQDLSIDHPKTVSEYANTLESLDALFIQAALLEDKLAPAPKKGKKLVFTDPFIFHAIRSWIFPNPNPFLDQILPLLQDTELCGALVEACVATHFRRFYPTFYIKAEGEVDVAYIDQNRFWPVEVKWTSQLRTKDLKQVTKYPQARIFSKVKSLGKLQGIPLEPIPWALLFIGENTQSE